MDSGLTLNNTPQQHLYRRNLCCGWHAHHRHHRQQNLSGHGQGDRGWQFHPDSRHFGATSNSTGDDYTAINGGQIAIASGTNGAYTANDTFNIACRQRHLR